MSANNCQWPGERSKKVVGIHEVHPILSLSSQVLALANQIATFTTRDAASRELAVVASSSSYNGAVVGLNTEQCQFVNNRNYNFQPNNNLSTYFHPGLRNQEKFSYVNPRNALQPPLVYPQPLAEKKPSCEEC